MTAPASGSSAAPVVCVTTAPALDRYYRVARLQAGSIHRPACVQSQAGGKGLHVAHVAHLLGADVRVVGILGGSTGAWIESRATDFTTRSRWAWTDGETRQCLCVLDAASGAMTEFYEPVAPVTADAWDRFESLLATELDDAGRSGGSTAALVVVSGRLPPGAPPDGIARVVESARDGGMHTAVDSAGESLRAGMASRPWMLKLNAQEAAELAGAQVRTPAEAVSAGRAMLESGVRHAIVTLGEGGAVYSGADSPSLLVRAPAVRHPLAVGSGDAFLGALAAGIQAALPLRDALVRATAAAAANAENFLAGDISAARVDQLCAHTRVTTLD